VSRRSKKLVREGDLVAEVGVELTEVEGGWSPYLSSEDAWRLDDVREALRVGDIDQARRLADDIYRLTSVAGESRTGGSNG